MFLLVLSTRGSEVPHTLSWKIKERFNSLHSIINSIGRQMDLGPNLIEVTFSRISQEPHVEFCSFGLNLKEHVVSPFLLER